MNALPQLAQFDDDAVEALPWPSDQEPNEETSELYAKDIGKWVQEVLKSRLESSARIHKGELLHEAVLASANRPSFLASNYNRLDALFVEAKSISEAYRLALKSSKAATIHALQEWEGYVVEVGSERFTARLLDKTAGSTWEEEIAEFSISEISTDDLPSLRHGSVFRWVIGHQITEGGQRRRVSQITFRRLPAWTKRELIDAKVRAANLAKEISWE